MKKLFVLFALTAVTAFANPTCSFEYARGAFLSAQVDEDAGRILVNGHEQSYSAPFSKSSTPWSTVWYAAFSQKRWLEITQTRSDAKVCIEDGRCWPCRIQ